MAMWRHSTSRSMGSVEEWCLAVRDVQEDLRENIQEVEGRLDSVEEAISPVGALRAMDERAIFLEQRIRATDRRVDAISGTLGWTAFDGEDCQDDPCGDLPEYNLKKGTGSCCAT